MNTSIAGIILYHHHNNDNTKSPNNEISSSLQTTLNTFLSLHLQSPSEKRIELTIDNNNIISEWTANDDYMIVVLYSRVVLEQNAGGLGMSWIQQCLLPDLMKEFILFKTHVDYTNNDESGDDDDSSNGSDNELFLMDKCDLFNATFNAIYQKSESKGRLDKMTHNYSSNNISSMAGGGKSTSTSSLSSMAQKGKKKKGKEDRVWFDGGEQKVTSKTMAKLDRSKKDDRLQQQDGNDDPMFIPDSSPALMEARAAYLPSEDEVPSWEHEDVLNDDDGGDNNDSNDSSEKSSSSGWGSSLKGMMDQFSGKYLTDEDLDVPLEEMEKMLTGKNVAREIAQDICLTVRKKLVGKKMASFTRVKTAVRQALEMAIEKILRPGRGRGGGEEVDLLRNVVSKRESGRIGSMFGKSSNEGKRP